MNQAYQISFYVPETHCEKVKQAMFKAGAGKFSGYDSCAWQTLGQGQFKPLEGSHPFIGNTEKIELVDEFRIEMICDASFIEDAIKALKSSHPYEVPAYSVIKLENY